MIASATWWKRAIPALLPLLLLGCSSLQEQQGAIGGPAPESLAPQRQPLAGPPAQEGPQQSANPLGGLNPLPSAQQVLAAVSLGRADPFAPLPPGPGGGAQPQPLPTDFRFRGVVRSGGQVQALVQFGSLSGSLSPGDVGGRTTALLPSGWRVAAVDAQRGRLSLRQGNQLVTVDL